MLPSNGHNTYVGPEYWMEKVADLLATYKRSRGLILVRLQAHWDAPGNIVVARLREKKRNEKRVG
jgi:hypothetical protein